MKRSFTFAFFFLTAWLLTRCSEEKCECRIMNTGIEVAFQNSAGNDLLNPATEGYLSKQDIKMFYEINGKLKTHASLASGAQLDNPDGFSIGSNGTQNVLTISSNPTAGKNVVTLLRIKGQSDIRLVTQVNDNGGSSVEKIWFEDQLVWARDMKTFPSVTVTLD